MLKITAIVSLMLIGSTLWAASLSCDSCGSECTSACGTRHFRSCCFNYLRRKRIDFVRFYTPSHDMKVESQPRAKLPMDVVESIPEHWFTNLVSGDYKPYSLEDVMENHLYEV